MNGPRRLRAITQCHVAYKFAYYQDFVALARRLRPVTALLAVMDAGSGAADYLATAQEQLADEGIKFELLTTDTYMPADDPYIHFDDEG